MDTTTHTTADINAWEHPKTGETRHYINNWTDLAGITVLRYGSGNIRRVEIDGYDGKVSNRKGGATAAGKVWIDTNGGLHFDYHSDLSLLTIDEKRARITAALHA